MTDKAKPKTLSKLQEARLKVIKQKEEAIGTMLTTTKNNPNFFKLLIFTLNSLENFVSPPNREIRLNASVMIRLDGVGILHTIILKNVTKDEIVTKAGDIIWKLISIYDNLDPELAKLFCEKDGHKAVIEILLKRPNGPAEVITPYVKVLNGLVQIPQLVPTLLESGLADTFNLDDTQDIDMITLNLDTLRKISNQKMGRDFLISKNFIDKILKNIRACAKKKSVDSVLCGLSILDNLCRNEEGKKAIKDAGGIDCLSEVLDLLGYDDSIIKMCAKIYSKIATVDDMKAQLELLRKYYEKIKAEGIDSVNLQEVNKCLALVSNFMLVDELGKQLQNLDNFKILEGLFNEIQKADLSNRDANFLNIYVLMNKYFMQIFYRLFSLQTDVYNTKTPAGQEEAALIKTIQDSIKKNWESVKKISNPELNDVFSAYFTAYGEIINQKYKVMNDNQEIDEGLSDVLCFINNNILSDGQNNFKKDDLYAHKMASNFLKISDDLACHNDKETKKDDLLKSLVNCYPYLEYLFTEKDDDEILCNSLTVLYDVLTHDKEFFDKNIENIIFKICDFMNKKMNHRYPSLQCMKLLDKYLTPDYVAKYIKERDPQKCPTHAIDFVECIVNVMAYRPNQAKDKKLEKSNSAKVEEEINEIGAKMIERLIDEYEFKNLLKEFCACADSFEPHNIKNKETVTHLEKLTKKMFGLMSVKRYYDLGASDVLRSLKNLVEKEVKYIEFYKRDKENQKKPTFNKTLEESSNRLFLEVFLGVKIAETSQEKLNYKKYVQSLDVLFTFLSKSSDIENINLLLDYFNKNFKFIMAEEGRILAETKENVPEKMTTTLTALLRKMTEEDKVVGNIIDNLILLAENTKSLCNTMVKGGCPRLLLQIIETSPYEENVEKALHLLKIIAFSNLNNLTMVANQNAMIKFFECKNKYPSNQKIINYCDEISNEILSKVPGQDKYLEELIKEAIAGFNENAKNDFSKPEIKQKLLNNIEIINSFSTNQAQFDNLNKETEFIANLKAVTDKTMKETNVTQVIEKLLTNELSLIKKLNLCDEFDHAYAIDKLIDVIKNKSNYRDLLLSAAEELSKYLKNDDLYNKFLKGKLDTSFVDAIFDDIDDYLGDIKVSKELNNILCHLCLRDPALADYIKKKGGLANVLEELKSNINSNDSNSYQMKLNAIKMLNSLCKDKDGMDLFVKVNGLELLNKLIENEAELYSQFKPTSDKDLFKTRETMDISGKDLVDDNKESENYIVYCINLIQTALSFGYKDFVNNKNIKNLLVIAEAEYPKKEVFTEICKLYNGNADVILPQEDNYLYLFIKQCLSYKAKYRTNNALCNEFDKTAEKILPKLKENPTYLQKVQKSVGENPNDPLQLTYLGTYVTLNDDFGQSYVPIIDSISKFTNDLLNSYFDKAEKEDREDVPEGIIISLMDLILYLLKNKKESAPDIDKVVQTLLFLGTQYINKKGRNAFSLLFQDKFSKIFDIVGRKNADGSLTPAYKKYIETVGPKSVPILYVMHKHLGDVKDYTKIDKDLEALYDLSINNVRDFYLNPEANLKLIKSQDLLNICIDLLKDMEEVQNYDKDKMFKQYDVLYGIILGLLSLNKDKELYTNNDDTFLRILSLMKLAKDKGYPDTPANFEKIMNILVHNLENSSEVFERITAFIADDFKQNPPKEVDINLDTLATQTKYSTAVKCLLNNMELTKNIHNLYKDDNISLPRRRNISNIYNNLTKNTYNVDTIIQEDPDTFKTIALKCAKPENAIKDKENIDIPLNEVNIITSVLKDNSNYDQVIEKKLITEDDLKNIINNYNGVDPRFDEMLKDLQAILDKMCKKEEKPAEVPKTDTFKVDYAILNNLKKRIEEAFRSHIAEVKKLNPNFEADDEEVAEEGGDQPQLSKQLGFVRKITAAPSGVNAAELTSSVKKRRLSVISRHLFYNYFNNQIVSPISTRIRDDIATALDSLLALIRLLYSGNRDSTDPNIKEQRMNLLKESVKVMKMLSICPDNHRPIVELGLLNFLEKLISDKKEENFQLYLGCLDVLKNCTWSESASLLLIDSPVLDKLIEEILEFYKNPDLVSQSDEMRSCFLYENILFSNILKCQKGFEAFFNKIGIDKLIIMAKNTGNVDFLTSLIEMLTNYLLIKKATFTDEQLADVLQICKKGLTLPDKSENLVSKTLKLIGLIYDDRSKDKLGEMDIVQIINSVWEAYKDEPEFFHNVVFVLSKVCLDNKKYSDEVVDTKLLDKILKYISYYEQNDDLIVNYSEFLKSLVEKNEPNRTKMCTEEVFNNILHLIDTYSPRIKPKKRGFTILKPQKTTFTLTSQQTMAEGQEAPPEIHNVIINNLLHVLELLTLSDACVDFITKNRFMGAILDTISKPNVDINVVIAALRCLANYFFKDTKSKWKHSEIEELFYILKTLQKEFYANSEVLTIINSIAGYILQGYKSKLYTERYYLLALEGLNCQDWNVDLVLVSLKILKEALESHEDLRNDVFEQTKQSVLNILRIYPNHLEVQKLCYEILTVFAENKVLSFNIVNSDVMESIRETMANQDFNSDTEKRLVIRITVFNLLRYLAYDDSTSIKISYELMESFIKDLLSPTYTEDLAGIAGLLATLFRTRQSIEPFTQYSGFEALCLDLDKFYEHKKFIVNCFRMIKEICYSCEENKKKLQDCKIVDNIKACMEKSKPEDKIIKFEGQIAITNINYQPGSVTQKPFVAPNYQEIKTTSVLKRPLYAFITSEIPVKAINPKGKVKEFILKFSPDLMKIYLCKPKLALIPPKPKYTLETPLCSIVKGYGTDEFNKLKGLFKSTPDRSSCLSIIQQQQQGEFKPKSLNIICGNERECDKIFGSFEVGIYYAKSLCGKEEKGKLCERNRFLYAFN